MRAVVTRVWTMGVLAMVVGSVTACGHQAPRVDCDKGLEAINVSLPKEKAAASGSGTKASSTGTTTP